MRGAFTAHTATKYLKFIGLKNMSPSRRGQIALLYLVDGES